MWYYIPMVTITTYHKLVHWLRPTKMYYLGSRGQKSKCKGWQGHTHLKTPGKDLFQVSTLTPRASGVPWLIDTSLHSSICTWYSVSLYHLSSGHAFLCVPISSFWEEHQSCWIKAHPHDLLLTWLPLGRRYSHVLRSWESELQHIFGGGAQLNQ